MKAHFLLTLMGCACTLAAVGGFARGQAHTPGPDDLSSSRAAPLQHVGMFGLGVGGSLSPAVSAQPPAGPTGSDALDDQIRAHMDLHHIPAVSAAIVKDGEVVWAKGYGLANISPPVRATEDTVFLLASVSKPVTATALMHLYDQGLFRLHDPVNSYLPFDVIHPDHPDVDITFHMVLTHSSGIRDNWSIMPIYDGDPPIPLGQYLEDYLTPGGAHYDPGANYYHWVPGTHHDYTNIGAALAGYLVEAISGTPLEDYCQQNVFGPLGMNETSWFLANLDYRNLAMPYFWNGTNHIPFGHYNVSWYPAGTLRTSAVQLAQFLAHFVESRQPSDSLPPSTSSANGGSWPVLQGDTVIMMTTPQIPRIHPDWGLFWFRYIFSNTEYWLHAGEFDGVDTAMSFRVRDGTGVIVLCNKVPADSFALSVLLYDYADTL